MAASPKGIDFRTTGGIRGENQNSEGGTNGWGDRPFAKLVPWGPIINFFFFSTLVIEGTW